jgi:hypothetical protein
VGRSDVLIDEKSEQNGKIGKHALKRTQQQQSSAAAM